MTWLKIKDAFKADPGILPQTGYPLQRRDWSDEWRDLKTRWHPGEALMVQDEPVIRKGEVTGLPPL